jgi:hypothetical protein
MKATIHVEIDIDAEALEREASRHGRSIGQTLIAVIADCENRCFDTLRYLDCVERVGVTVVHAPRASTDTIETRGGGGR